MYLNVYNTQIRGEKLMDPVVEAQLHCRISPMSSPYLILQPVKMEQISIKPPVTLFYDVLSDEEIETIQNMANPLVLHPSRKIAADDLKRVSCYCKARSSYNTIQS